MRGFALLLVVAAALGFWHKHRAAQERALQREQAAAAPPAQAPIAAHAAAPAQPAPESPAPADEQMQRLRREAEKQFRSADTDGDGYLSRREARARFPFLARVFGRVDTDGDGRISFDEFLAFRREQLERKLER